MTSSPAWAVTSSWRWRSGHSDRQALDHLTSRLHAALSAPMEAVGKKPRVTASIGVV
ncbi:hypothetical protein [Mycobacterium sp. GA-2829]|uniref:hypothetical protein n=1 Tax=Mycobacterium sp. GA-2829 TaxID=1772283 RepID=UPI001E4C4B57|nr:hypothetical protein [Mycobacterium sp. GA-2829]